MAEDAHGEEALMTSIADAARIPNPALAPLARLVGSWTSVGSHGMMPGTELHGRATFEWIEGGAFLKQQSELDDPRFPAGIAIIGSDDDSGKLMILYFDQRGVSRHYESAVEGNVWRWWRNAPGFSQRYSCTISDDGRTMVGKGELSKDGKSWEKDLDLTYTRA
jgi:hypothetical protein